MPTETSETRNCEFHSVFTDNVSFIFIQQPSSKTSNKKELTFIEHATKFLKPGSLCIVVCTACITSLKPRRIFPYFTVKEIRFKEVKSGHTINWQWAEPRLPAKWTQLNAAAPHLSSTFLEFLPQPICFF